MAELTALITVVSEIPSRAGAAFRALGATPPQISNNVDRRCQGDIDSLTAVLRTEHRSALAGSLAIPGGGQRKRAKQLRHPGQAVAEPTDPAAPASYQ